MGRMKYVQRRANRFEFRFALPDDLAGKPLPARHPEALGPIVNSRTARFKLELIKSLQTSDIKSAERRVLPEIERAHRLVETARQFLRHGPRRSVSPEVSRILINSHEIDLLGRDETLRQRGIGLDLEVGTLEPRGTGMTDDDDGLYRFTIAHLDNELRAEVAKARPGASIKASLDGALDREGIALDLDDPERRDLELGFMNARRRAFDAINARLNGEVVPTPVAPAEVTGLTLSEALQRWEDGGGRGAKKPREQSASEARRSVSRFIELHGDLPLAAITKAQGRSFRDALAKLPTTLPLRLSRMRLGELLKQDLSRYTPRRAQTVNKTLALLGGIVARAERDGYFDNVPGWSNPFHVGFEIASAEKMPYEPFSPEELKALFASPVYALGKRPKGGVGEAAYWFPLIALYSGARRTEIAQLTVGDLRSTPGGIWFFDINDEGAEQNLKNASSARSVPVHPELVRLGLLDYLAKRREKAESTSALWPGFEPPAAAKAKAWTKWFGRYLAANVVDHPAKTFHSFRHTFKRACREAGITEEVHHALTGHTGGGVGRSYGRERRADGSLDRGISLRRLHEELSKIRYAATLTELVT